MTTKSNGSRNGSTTRDIKITGIVEKETPVGAMKDVYTDLTEGIQSVDVRCEELGVCMAQLQDRMDGLVHFVKDLSETYSIFLNRLQDVQDTVKRMDQKLDNQVQKLLDRLIEMAMVNSGQPVEAVTRRVKGRIDSDFSDEDSWSVGDETPGDVWPPEGCDSMELKG